MKIDPCIPADWKDLRITRRFRKKTLSITIKNEGGAQKGVQRIVLNGEEIEGNVVPFKRMKEKNDILVVM